MTTFSDDVTAAIQRQLQTLQEEAEKKAHEEEQQRKNAIAATSTLIEQVFGTSVVQAAEVHAGVAWVRVNGQEISFKYQCERAAHWLLCHEQRLVRKKIFDHELNAQDGQAGRYRLFVERVAQLLH